MNTKPTYEELEISLALYRDAYNTLFYKQIDTQDDLERIKEQTADHLDALHFQCEEIVKLEAEVAKIAKKITIANREHDVLKYRFDTLQTTHTHLWEECHEAWMTIKDSHFSSFETPGPEVGCELSLSDALTNIFTQVYKDQEKQNNKYDVLFKSVGRAWHAIGRSHYNSVVNTEREKMNEGISLESALDAIFTQVYKDQEKMAAEIEKAYKETSFKVGVDIGDEPSQTVHWSYIG